MVAGTSVKSFHSRSHCGLSAAGTMMRPFFTRPVVCNT